MAPPILPYSPANVTFAQVADTQGRVLLFPTAALEALAAAGLDTLTLTIKIPTAAAAQKPGLTVTEAAAELMRDEPALDFNTAKALVSRAARSGKVRSTGEGTDRRIDADSLAAWRLERRDRALDDVE